jgi:hypothetical protein
MCCLAPFGRRERTPVEDRFIDAINRLRQARPVDQHAQSSTKNRSQIIAPLGRNASD